MSPAPFVTLSVMLTSCQLKREGLNVQVVVATIHGHNQRWWKIKSAASSPLPTLPLTLGAGGGNVRPIPRQIGIRNHNARCLLLRLTTAPQVPRQKTGSKAHFPPSTMRVEKPHPWPLSVTANFTFANRARPSIWTPSDIRRHRADSWPRSYAACTWRRICHGAWKLGGGWSSSGSHARPWTDSWAGLMRPWPIFVLYPRSVSTILHPLLVFQPFCLWGVSGSSLVSTNQSSAFRPRPPFVPFIHSYFTASVATHRTPAFPHYEPLLQFAFLPARLQGF